MAEYTEARKKANKAWDNKNLDRISIAMPKGSKDALKAHTELTGESMNAFINRAVMEVYEADTMHRAYQRALLRHLRVILDCWNTGNNEKATELLKKLIQDTTNDIG